MVGIGYFLALGYGLLCLLLSLVIYKFGVPKKYTRKLVHILVGFEWVILYHTVGAGVHFTAVCLLFTALLLFTYKKSLMPMISSESDNAPGTVYYGVSMTLMSIVSCFADGFVFAFGIAVFCTSFGDGLAGVIGAAIKKFNPKIYKNKTLFGTLAAFVFSFASALIFSAVYDLPIGILESIYIAFFSAGLELVTGYGLDNIAIPIGTSALSFLLISFENVGNYLVPILLTPIIIAICDGRKLLTPRGIICAVILDIIVSLSLGNFGFVLLLSFLVLSVLIDKFKKRQKGLDRIAKKGERRDEVQVIANGSVAAFMAILYLVFSDYAFIIGYSVALAEAFADTAASGIGSLSKSAFDPFRFKRVPVGLSGGMSIPGTAASLIAPFAFLTIALAFGAIDLKMLVFCTVFAFFGAILDSFLGSLIQCKYKCDICGALTEKESHCGKATSHISGISFIDNDTVNILSSAVSSFAAVIAYVIFL